MPTTRATAAGARPRLLLTFENTLPSPEADAEVFVNTAAALARQGAAARLIVPEPAGGGGPAYVQEVRRYYGLHGPLELRTVPSWRAHIGLQHVYHAARVPEHARAFGADLVYTRNLAVVSACIAGGVPVAFDHYRPWGDQVPPLQGPIHHLMGRPSFVGMICHSDLARQAYRRIGVPDARLRVIHNGFDERRMGQRLSRAEARRRLGLPARQPTVVYTGRINHRKGLDIVLAMAAARPAVRFVLVGSRGEGAVERAAAALPNVQLVPWQAFAETVPFLYAADVLIVPPSQEPLQRFGSTVLPLKVYLYLAAGRAILAGRTPDIVEILQDEAAALLVNPGDLGAATAALDRLLADGRLRARLGQHARRAAADLTWDARARRILAFLQERQAATAVPPAGPLDRARWARESGAWLHGLIRRGRWVRPAVAP